ncbi:alpha-L-rhamnosidase [Scatolibacter rhodanostii]|uniref:alpha-L-rhamnosidase n=1 Tax=Scatolibacter rhodanostii TaxID=2014781 RepID=UPI000C085869|nr:alpha-L-rhamnosidase [Scatolibacter rhodanostii]
MQWKANWIKPIEDFGDICPLFSKEFISDRPIKAAKLFITSLGVYEAVLNGNRIGNFVLAPGWTSYAKRLQYQEYDVTSLLSTHNQISVTVGKGWYRSRLGWESFPEQKKLQAAPAAFLAQLEIFFQDGTTTMICSDNSWLCGKSNVLFSEIYDGETYDASYLPVANSPVETFEGPFSTLIEQQGEDICEQEQLRPARRFQTPKGEWVFDFGQEVTGYVEINLTAKAGDKVVLSHAEVMDKDGNFYTENYRSAKAKYCYVCKDGKQTYKPKLTFFGFRYIRVDQFPNGTQSANLENFSAIVVHSALKRTGHLSCSNPLLNQLFENIIWGQKGNFLDIPTDCPQRDERLGWTGDAQVFVKTAALNFNVEKFFTKWLSDMSADQEEDGRIGHVIPDIIKDGGSAAWGDAAVICPWEIYLAYGNTQILSNQFNCMKKWIDYITSHTQDKNLWTGGTHFGDWLGLDAPVGSYKGSSREDFIASAFYAYSTSLVIKAGKILGEDVSQYKVLYKNITSAFQNTYPEYMTQTECVLAAHFKLAPDCQSAADQLADMIRESGIKLQTGFVGTPYLLHVLSDYGHTELAYSLLLREQYPSWLYPVTKGATTIWEHWDGIMENGDFWSPDMNSYNHYAYGAVADWVYGTAAGIKTDENAPGYEKVIICPNPDQRLTWLKASLETKHGLIRSEWKKKDDVWQYEIETPTNTSVSIANQTYEVKKGTYIFYSACDK